jgi:hypothetical protein
MQLSKTDFIQYLNCPKSLWLLKHEPEAFPHGEFSVFLQKLTREGYEVESYVRQYFQAEKDHAVDFQKIFETEDGLYARIDALEGTSDGKTILYEIKSSTSVKTDAAHNHIKDACFQKICAERAGLRIDRVYLVHLNGQYVRKGDVDPTALLVFSDITDAVCDTNDETTAEIESALNLLQNSKLDRSGCSCLYKSRGNHCDTFSLFNRTVPTPSIFSLPRLSAKKRKELVDGGVFDLRALPEDFALSANQQIVLQAARTGAAQVDLGKIRRFLDGLRYPLHFFDFETYASAVPRVDGASPHKAFPVQYSLHILDTEGTLVHKEFLERKPRLPDRLVRQMQADFKREGSVVSWHASFEKSQNREMAALFPESTDFLNDLNDRMVDLEDVFKTAYVDAAFDGSTSIKKVLPVIRPDLSYEDLDVQDGSLAMEAWERLIGAEDKEAAQIGESLLRYCERDTFAMVEIYRFLTHLVKK